MIKNFKYQQNKNDRKTEEMQDDNIPDFQAQSTNQENSIKECEFHNDASVPVEDNPGSEEFSDPLTFLKNELERLETKNVELKDQMIRTTADMENLRRRTRKDVSDAREYSISTFARDMLLIGDNLRRAMNALPPEITDSADEGIKALIEGLCMTEREMLSIMERNGVKKITPLHERFDPHFHQAMFEVQNPELENNTVVEIVQDGYIIGSRILRPAMVGIAKGGPKPETVQNKKENPYISENVDSDIA